jgi:hypothetical protein
MNTKKRIKFLLTLAVLAMVVLPLVAASALTVKIYSVGSDANRGYIYNWSGNPAQVDLHITDAVTDVNDLTIEWHSNYDTIDPNFIWTYEQEDPSDPNIWNVTCTKPKPDGRTYTYPEFYVTVTDDVETATDSERFFLYDDACMMGKLFFDVNPADLNGDCITNLADCAIMATAWMEDYTTDVPLPIGL